MEVIGNLHTEWGDIGSAEGPEDGCRSWQKTRDWQQSRQCWSGYTMVKSLAVCANEAAKPLLRDQSLIWWVKCEGWVLGYC